MNPPPSSPEPEPGGASAGSDPILVRLLLDLMRPAVDKRYHAQYLATFFERLEDGAPVTVRKWVVGRFKKYLCELKKTLGSIYEFFDDDETRRRLENRVRCVLYKRMHADVLECCCFIYETLKRRAGSYDEKRKSHEAWIMGSVRNMVREWLKSKKGQGKSPYETGESDLAGVDGAGGSFSGIRASLLAATADPSEELVASEDNKRFYEELGRALDEKSCRLLDLLDLQGLPMLAVARRLGYQAPSEQTALDLARLLIADRFTDTAKLIVLYHLSPCGKESPGDFVKRVELRMAQVSVLATRVEARAALAGIAPRELLSEAARVLSGGRLRPAAEALTRAGMAPLRGETVEQFSKRIHYARGGLGDADAQLEKLDDNKLAARVRREVCDLHKECRRLVEQNPELDALARAIMKRISQSGPDAPEVLPNKDHNDLFQEEERSPGENRKKEHQNNEESKGAA